MRSTSRCVITRLSPTGRTCEHRHQFWPQRFHDGRSRHPRFRRIFQKAFLPNVVSNWGESVVDPVIDSLMSQFEGAGTADLVQEFTFHYPFQIVYRQLGLPAAEVGTFHKLAMAQILVSVDVAHGTEASRKLGTYFDALIEERRRNPGN